MSRTFLLLLFFSFLILVSSATLRLVDVSAKDRSAMFDFKYTEKGRIGAEVRPGWYE